MACILGRNSRLRAIALNSEAWRPAAGTAHEKVLISHLRVCIWAQVETERESDTRFQFPKPATQVLLESLQMDAEQGRRPAAKPLSCTFT